MYWLLDLYEYGLVTRDCNDLTRRPTGTRQTPAYRRYLQSGKSHASTPDDVAARHAESTPENPQGGRWVKMRISAAGVPLGHEQMLNVLSQYGYRTPAKEPDGPESR